MIHLYKIYVTTLVYKMFCYITEGIILNPSKFALDFLSVFVPGHIHICTHPSLNEEDRKEKEMLSSALLSNPYYDGANSDLLT